MGSTMGKIENATELLENRVLNPVRRVRGIMSAVNAGLGILRSTRASAESRAARAGQDEEMFI